jgi:hypothetical protein
VVGCYFAYTGYACQGRKRNPDHYQGKVRPLSLSEDGPDPEKEDKVMLVRSRLSRIYYLKDFFDYPID